MYSTSQLTFISLFLDLLRERILKAAIVVFLGLTGLIVHSIPVAAADKNVVSFCFNDFPPYAFSDPNEGNTGVSVSIISEAARRLNITATFIELPWKRCLHSVREGMVDAVLDAASRPDFIQGPTSFSSYNDTIWVRNDSAFMSTDDLQGQTIGLISGYNYNPALLQLIERHHIMHQEAKDDPTNVKKLAFRRVDAIIGDKVSTAYFAKQHGLELRAIDSPVKADKLYVSFNDSLANLQRSFDGVLKDLKADGFVDRAYTSYLGEHWSEVSPGKQ